MQRTRRKALLALAAPGIALAAALPAQERGAGTADAEQQGLIDKRDKKLAAEFFKRATWFTDLAKARAAAKASGKKIFAYFSRSYAP